VYQLKCGGSSPAGFTGKWITMLAVQGKGKIRFEVNGIVFVIPEVFYVPDLKNNLLSLGQLQEKGMTVLIQHGK
jgi:hypothetical protein